MGNEPSNIEKVINGLKGAQEGIADLIGESHSMLNLQCQHTIGQLIAKLSHAAGLNVGGQPFPEKKPLTHIFGVELKAPSVKKVTKEVVTPSETEVSELQQFTDSAWKEFLTLPASELKERYGDLVIRAVAVKAGMDVTPTSPEKVNVAFINEVKKAVTFKDETQKAIDEADQAAKELKEKIITEETNQEGNK